MTGITDRFHSGVNALCRRCKNVFTIHPSQCSPEDEYQCEGCDKLAEQNEIGPDVNEEPISPEKPPETYTPVTDVAVEAEHPETPPAVAAILPDGNKDNLIDHVTVDEMVARDAEQHGQKRDEAAETQPENPHDEQAPEETPHAQVEHVGHVEMHADEVHIDQTPGETHEARSEEDAPQAGADVSTRPEFHDESAHSGHVAGDSQEPA